MVEWRNGCFFVIQTYRWTMSGQPQNYGHAVGEMVSYLAQLLPLKLYNSPYDTELEETTQKRRPGTQ